MEADVMWHGRAPQHGRRRFPSMNPAMNTSTMTFVKCICHSRTPARRDSRHKSTLSIHPTSPKHVASSQSYIRADKKNHKVTGGGEQVAGQTRGVRDEEDWGLHVWVTKKRGCAESGTWDGGCTTRTVMEKPRNRNTRSFPTPKTSKHNTESQTKTHSSA